MKLKAQSSKLKGRSKLQFFRAVRWVLRAGGFPASQCAKAGGPHPTAVRPLTARGPRTDAALVLGPLALPLSFALYALSFAPLPRGAFFSPALIAALVLLALRGVLPEAHAHRTSDSYLALTVEEGRLSGKWDIGIADLAPIVGLKPGSGAILSAADIQTCLARAAGYALPRLKISGDGRPGIVRLTERKLEHHTDGVFAALRFAVDGLRDVRELEIQYRLFFDDDPLHRGLMMLEEGERNQTAVFHLESPRQVFHLTSVNWMKEFTAFFREGGRHIWTGYDHVLFLLALLLPAVLRRAEDRWLGVERFRPALVQVVKIVTAFTIAHSITLSLAALQVVNLPSRWVESAIAASVILAAANNLRPCFRGREWLVTFAFGLVHGLGFASALGELGLRRENLWPTLAAFNLGVEGGQLVIVAGFLPVAYRLRTTAFYQRALVTGGSVVILLIAVGWLIERVWEVKLFPG